MWITAVRGRIFCCGENIVAEHLKCQICKLKCSQCVESQKIEFGGVPQKWFPVINPSYVHIVLIYLYF